MIENDAKKLHIVSYGTNTALGNSTDETLTKILEDDSPFYEHPRWVDTYGEKYVLGIKKNISPYSDYSDRIIALALPAIEQALMPLNKALLNARCRKITIFMGVDAGLSAFSKLYTREITQCLLQKLLSLGWPIRTIWTLKTGHVSHHVALCEAYAHLMKHSEDIVLAGSVSTYCHCEILSELEKLNLLHSINNTWGFIPGEAASFQNVCLSNSWLKAEPVGYILRANHTKETEYKPYTDQTPLGKALSETCSSVLSELEACRGVGNIFADLNGERWRGTEYGMSSLRISPWLENPSNFSTVSQALGDIGAATGGVMINIAIEMAKRQLNNGDYTLCWLADINGYRSASLLHIPIKNEWIANMKIGEPHE